MRTTMTKANDVTGWYSNVFKAWRVADLGAKPTAEMLANIHGLGARPGKQALASAMALRECGVTGAQIVMACGAPQLNKMRGFITDGLLKREAANPDKVGHTVYKLAVTAKGTKRIEAAVKRASELAAKGEGDTKPVKKATSKPRKAKAAPKAVEADKPVEAPPVTEQSTTVDQPTV